jgi:hypothetical protein
MCACRETDVRKSAEKFHPFYAAAVFPWWLNALYYTTAIRAKICKVVSFFQLSYQTSESTTPLLSTSLVLPVSIFSIRSPQWHWAESPNCKIPERVIFSGVLLRASLTLPGILSPLSSQRAPRPTELNSVAWIRDRTTSIVRPPLVGEISANSGSSTAVI